jgi:thioredoxin reductase (NADPH)
VVEYAEELGASRNLAQKVRDHDQFEIMTNHEVVAFEGKGGKLKTVKVKDRSSGEVKELHPAAAFVFIGLDPNAGFLKGSVDLDERGFIETSDTFETSQPGVYAAGDVRAGSTKQLASAVGEGAAVLLMVRKRIEKLKDSEH